MKFCILPRLANEFKQAIINGQVDINKLREMSSKERNDFFSKYFGENDAKKVNALYEQKLLLKNYERAMVTWAKKVTGISVEKKRDLQNRIQNMIKRGELTADNADKFLSDLVEYRLGASVSESEAKEITRLSGIVKDKEKFSTEKQRIDYGLALQDLYAYTDKITKRKAKLRTTIVDALNIPRAIMTSFDLSGLFNQGYAAIGSKEWRKSAKNVVKLFASEKKYNEVMADIITRENYDLAKKSGLRITKLSDKLSEREDGFMSTIAEKIPGIRASERAYTGFLNKLRMDTFDRLIEAARLQGEDVNSSSETTKNIANTINSFTGSGNVGKFEQAVPLLNTLFFSPRKIAATLNMFNPKTYFSGSVQARKYAWTRLLNMAVVYGIARGLASLFGGEPEDDPRSVNFGKVKIGNRWIDFSGGNGRFANLLYSLASGETKQTDTGIIKKLNDGSYNQTTKTEILLRYLRNKLSPLAGSTINALSGQDYLGEKFSFTKELVDSFIPMSLNDIFDAMSGNEEWDDALFATALNIVGINSYAIDKAQDWTKSTNKQVKQFRQKADEKTFDEANNLFNTLYKEKLQKLVNSPEYNRKTDENKQKDITELKESVKEAVFKRYNFKYNKKLKDEDIEKSQKTKSGSYVKSSDAPNTFYETSDLYLKSAFTDPVKTISAFISGQPLRKIENGIVIIERKNGIGNDGNPNTELDHILDLRFGGTNDESNLMWLTKSEHEVKTKVGDMLMEELKAGNITKKEAKNRIINWKNEINNLKKKDAEDLVEKIMKS